MNLTTFSRYLILLVPLVALLATSCLTTAAVVLQKDMRNKTALCLGCTRGIGEATARQMASLGANVVVAGRSVDDGTKIANDIGGVFVRCDMAERDELERAFQVATDQYGGIDAVFCNGGTEGSWNPIDEISPETIDMIGRLNGLAPLHVYDLAVRAFLKNGGGSLVFTSSIATFVNEAISSHVPSSGMVYYAGTKAIAPAMTRASAMMPAEHNIRVNTIAPGVFYTQMLEDLLFKSKFARQIGAKTASDWAGFNPALPGCASDPKDAATAAVALLSNNSHWPPSAVIVTDGPYTLESNVLTDKLGRNQVWTGSVDASFLRDAAGAPINVTNQDIQDMVAACIAVSNAEKTKTSCDDCGNFDS